MSSTEEATMARSASDDATTAQRLDEMEDDVTTWEAEFLASIRTQLAQGRVLSEKQGQILDDMEEKYA